MSNAARPNRRVLGVFTLSMINVAAILSLRNFPVMSEYGLGMIFYYSVSALFFLVPVSLISAELATTWPVTGGVYVWVREALGERMGADTFEAEHVIAGHEVVDPELVLEPGSVEEVLGPVLLPGEIGVEEIHRRVEYGLAGRPLERHLPDCAGSVEALKN